MRHSDIRLTMGTYTDPRLLDVAGAMDSLPFLPLMGESRPDGTAAGATGADGSLAVTLAVTLAVAPDKSRQITTPDHSTPVKIASAEILPDEQLGDDVSVVPANRKRPSNTGVYHRFQKVETSGLEPPTPSLQS